MTSFQAMKLFIRVVDLGSFSKAAIDLGIGQPSATKQVAQLEKQLGSRLLHRSTHGITPTEAGLLVYEKFKLIMQHVDETASLALLMHSQVQGKLRVSTTMDFGRRVLTPLVVRFLELNPTMQIELLFDDRIVDMVEQGIDVAIRMGQLVDSTLGSRYLGRNPWSVVASPEYLARHGEPAHPLDLTAHQALIISTVQNDSRWHFLDGNDKRVTVQLKGPMRSNNKSALAFAACVGLGIAALPTYVVHSSVTRGALKTVLCDWPLPTQEINAVYPSPSMVPIKVRTFVDWLQTQFSEGWWKTSFELTA
jgi:DNA-binding transcriptional LysR family regulator